MKAFNNRNYFVIACVFSPLVIQIVFNLSLLHILNVQNLICKHAEVSSNWIQESPFSLILSVLSLDPHLNIAGQSQAWGKSKHDA